MTKLSMRAHTMKNTSSPSTLISPRTTQESSRSKGGTFAIEQLVRYLTDLSTAHNDSAMAPLVGSSFLFRGRQLVSIMVDEAFASSTKHAIYLGDALVERGHLHCLGQPNSRSSAVASLKKGVSPHRATSYTLSSRGNQSKLDPFLNDQTIYRFIPHP